jgi:mono/diheme cytochrome c family protein
MMNRLIASIACLFLVSLTLVCDSAGQEFQPVGKNLIENGGFEDLENDLPAGWVKRTWSGDAKFGVETEFGHTGDSCIILQSESGADASWSFEANLKPNSEYRLTAWIKSKDLEGSGLGGLLNLHQLQMEGKSDALKGTNNWKKVTTQFNSGPHSNLLVNCLFGGWGQSTGTVWFDDLELVELKKKAKELPPMSEAESKEFFETKVLPVFKDNCFGCHGGGEKIKAQLVMTNRADFIKGGESGAAIELDDPMDSLLLSAINYDEYEMPPSGKLPQKDIDNITEWVMRGAPWSGEGFKPTLEPTAHAVPQVNSETKQWWSYQPPATVDVPNHTSWASSEIDQFVLDQLVRKGLAPNPEASRQTLVRRAFYDLTGLPPSPEEVKAFVNDDSPEAYEQLLDRLLDSKHYGEKWGRHWLDLVRYAESNSYERDGTKPFVWRYRDYVINSFNEDKPYSQFIVEQLAGDELENQTPESLIATGYYRLGLWDDEPVDHEQAWFDDMDDVLKTTSQTFLAMTVDCARCHDHKIDPIPQSDYYSMLSFFRNVQRYGVRGHDTVLRQSSRPIAPPEAQANYAAEVDAHRTATDENQKALVAIEELVKTDFIPVEHEEFRHEMNRVPLVKKRVGKKLGEVDFTEEQAEQYAQLFEEMKRLRRERPKALEACLCVTETGKGPKETYVLIRGNAHAQSDEVQPGFPSVLSPPTAKIVAPSDGESLGRRLALAKWIASDENPLTARVMVNRVWQHHFGRGIVRSASDFGFQGTAPTHPKLLDWLAKDFMDGGWKLKRLHKLIMMSSTYRMSSASNEKALAVDPTNDLFWRFNMRRLTAEEVRDSILAVNQTLNRDKMFGPSIYPVIPREILQGQSRPGENWGKSSPEDIVRRSVYIHIKRSLPVPMMASFDVNDPDSTCAVRFNTVQPTQALGMLNSEFVNQEAAKFAENIRSESNELPAQVDLILKRVFQRAPTESESKRGLKFIDRMQELGHDEAKSLELYCVVALNLNEFLYLD